MGVALSRWTSDSQSRSLYGQYEWQAALISTEEWSR